MEGRTKVILDRVVPELGPFKTVKKAIFLEDIMEYEEYKEHNQNWTKVYINGESILINLSFEAFDIMYDEELQNSIL